MSEVKRPVRVYTRISHDTNEWLDRKSVEMALSKSSLINMAIENYRRETEVIKGLPELVSKLKDMGYDVDKFF